MKSRQQHISERNTGKETTKEVMDLAGFPFKQSAVLKSARNENGPLAITKLGTMP